MASEALAPPGLRGLTRASRDVCFLCCLQLAGRAHPQDWTSALRRSLQSSCRRDGVQELNVGRRGVRGSGRAGLGRPSHGELLPQPGVFRAQNPLSLLLKIAFWTPRGSQGWPPLSDRSTLLPGGLSRSDQGPGALPAGRPSCQSLMFPAMINLINNKYINLVF